MFMCIAAIALVDLIGVPFSKKSGAASGPIVLQEKLNIKCLDINDDENCVMKKVKERVSSSYRNQNIPVCIGGDKSIALGTTCGVSSQCPSILWISSDIDFNNGTPLSFISGAKNKIYKDLCDIPYSNDRIHIFGIDKCSNEDALLSSNMSFTSMSCIKFHGMNYSIRKVLEKMQHKVHLIFDVHVINSEYCPGVDRKSNNGFDLEELDILLSMLRESGKIRSMDIVEFNPNNDYEDRTANCINYMLEKLFY